MMIMYGYHSTNFNKNIRCTNFCHNSFDIIWDFYSIGTYISSNMEWTNLRQKFNFVSLILFQIVFSIERWLIFDCDSGMTSYDGIHLAMFWFSSIVLAVNTHDFASPIFSFRHTCSCHSTLFILTNKFTVFDPVIFQIAWLL